MRIRSYQTPSRRDPVGEFIAELPLETRTEIFTLLRRLENNEILSMPHSRSMASMASGLHELRIRDREGQVRVFYYTKIRDVIYLVHALRKKSRVISDKDRDLIVKRIRELNS